ncbi:hypothetical protein TRFO_36895 [Tritrichomonas foetus]|uniref:Uncharacterized protein n=1 Tax=Tritrichomonas foetus TaxID=1144522 RepID=A0A1J4JCP1_9EUKA|nr:hypothetical protein TRFO_36895 [Tritrichomonas foetus]|eukprot:OHS96970.1 hypothetical protein TRFO_36895 [Tritrichomonas foetus]
MLPILKSAIEYSKLRNFPLSSEEENSPQIYISSLPTIPFSIINAENNAMMHIINEKENNKNKNEENEENEEKEKNEENEEKNENENDGKNEMRNNAGKLVKRQINDRDDEDDEVKNLVDHLTQCDGTFPLCNPSKIKKLPDGFEKMTNLNKKSSEVTVTDLLTALREDRVTDTYKLQSSYATAYIRRSKK